MPSTLNNYTLTLQAPKGVIPDLATDSRDAMLAMARFFEALAGGMAPGQPGESQVTIAKGATDAQLKEASVLQTFASAVVTNTSVLNGVTFTAIKQRATGTLTAATAIAGTTAVIGGITFTGVAGAPVLPGDFSIDTGDNETAASLAAAINAHASLAGIVTATAASAVVTVRAVTAGTAGNAITLVGTVTVLAASASTLLGGIAVANDQFDISPGGTNAQAATDFVRAVNASTTPAAMLVKGCNIAGTIALASVLAGDYVEIDGFRFTAFPGTPPDRFDRFDMSGTNTADGTSLLTAINAHPVLSRRVLAEEASGGANGTITIRQRSGTTALKIAASSSTFTVVAMAETAVALITAKEPGLIGNAITSTSSSNITSSAAKLSGGIGGNSATVLSYP